MFYIVRNSSLKEATTYSIKAQLPAWQYCPLVLLWTPVISLGRQKLFKLHSFPAQHVLSIEPGEVWKRLWTLGRCYKDFTSLQGLRCTMEK